MNFFFSSKEPHCQTLVLKRGKHPHPPPPICCYCLLKRVAAVFCNAFASFFLAFFLSLRPLVSLSLTLLAALKRASHSAKLRRLRCHQSLSFRSLLETGTSGVTSGKSRQHLPGCRQRQRHGAESAQLTGLGAFASAHQWARSGCSRTPLKKDPLLPRRRHWNNKTLAAETLVVRPGIPCIA